MNLKIFKKEVAILSLNQCATENNVRGSGRLNSMINTNNIEYENNKVNEFI